MVQGEALEVIDWMAESYWDLSLDMLCISGLDGVFRRVNPAWTMVLGWSELELCSRPFVSFVHPDDRERTRGETAKLAEGGLTLAFENRYQHCDGSYRTLEWRARASLAHGVIFASARDATEIRRAGLLETRLVQVERLASLGTLAAGMGHEINNPMVGVIANVTYAEDAVRAALAHLEAPDVGDAGVRDAIHVLRGLVDALGDAASGAERVRGVVHDLRRFARGEAMVAKQIDLPAVIETAIEQTANQVRHSAHVVRDLRQTPPVIGDADQLTQVLGCLLVNAGQAIRPGSPQLNEIRIATSTNRAGNAAITVTDTGPGIAAELLPRIFDPFFTTKDVGEGMGLGLALAHRFVELLGGEIAVESPPGRGATFRIILPAARVQPRTQSIPLPVIPPARARILVIDDEAVVTRSLQRILRGHEVQLAHDGQTALAMIAEHHYDMILCDLMMPQMSGVDLYERVCTVKPAQAQRMVFMTGGAFTPRTTKFLETTGNRMLLKPFTADTLRGIAADVIATGTAASPPR